MNKLQSIIEKCVAGDTRSQELLYRTFSTSMMGICIRYSSDLSEAEDILQTGFIKIFAKISTFKNEGSFEGWMKRIMINTGIEYYRKKQRSQAVENLEDCSLILPDQRPGSSLDVKDLLNIVQQLPPHYRTVFTLHAIEGYSHKEIAGLLNITELASRANLCRAREILKKHILKINLNEPEYLAC